MRLLIDGNVYLWQRAGGISRMYSRLIPLLMTLEPAMRIDMFLAGKPVSRNVDCFKDIVRVIPQIGSHLKPWRLWSRLGPIVNRWVADMFWRSQSADVFFSTYYTSPRVKCPTICVVYDMIFELFPDFFNKKSYREVVDGKRKAIASADIVVCISETTRKDVIRILGMPPEKCRTIYLAGNIEGVAETAARREDRRPFFLYVGDYSTGYKNFAFMLKCLGSTEFGQFADVRLIVVSPRKPSADELEQFKRIFPPTRLTFVADCSDSELAGFYKDCSAFICPSLYEGFGIPVLEALTLGAPVVCSRASALLEVGGAVADYFDPRSPAEFHLALAKALGSARDHDKVEQRQTHARQFTWEKTARSFLDVIKEASVIRRPTS